MMAKRLPPESRRLSFLVSFGSSWIASLFSHVSLQTLLVDLSLLNCSRRNRSVLFPVYPDDCVAKR